MPQPLLYESHMHTPLCHHATGEPEEYAAVARERNLKGIIVTCHNPLPDGLAASSRMTPEQFDEYVALVDRARQRCADFCDVRLGFECDFIPGLEGFLEKQLAQATFHHVLGSVHIQLAEYMDQYFTGDAPAYQRLYFDLLAQAAETQLFDTISHPDLVKNMFHETWRVGDVLDAIGDCLDRIAATDTAMELNTSGLNKLYPEMNPGPVMLEQMAQRGIPVVIGADAHVPERAGDAYPQALRHLADAGYSHVSQFLDRRRQDIAITDALVSLVETEPAER
jgi:histidinol-phosphatase (PHP family)